MIKTHLNIPALLVHNSWVYVLDLSPLSSCFESSSSLSSLIPLAVQAVRTAFRLGSRVSTTAEQAEPTTDQSKTWSTRDIGLAAEDADAAMSESNHAHVSTNPWLGILLITVVVSLEVEMPLHERCRLHIRDDQRTFIYA